jgi:indolepyruvate ferredoxin oxidoreductase beta subunit
MKNTINFLLAGVGGQGTILASGVLVNVGLASGYQAKQAEVHGMSQRGGSVTSFVRWGKVVYSPLVGAGEVDILLAFEKVEALRCLRQLRPGALVLVNMEAIEPLTVTSGDAIYPDDDRLYAAVAQVTDQAAYIRGLELASQIGNARAANVVLLGALSALMERHGPKGPQVPVDTWLSVIIERVPVRYVELNKHAFEVGREAVLLKA